MLARSAPSPRALHDYRHQGYDAPDYFATKCTDPGRRVPGLAHVRPGNFQRARHPAHPGNAAAWRLQGLAMDNERLHPGLHHRADGHGHPGRPLWPQAPAARQPGAVRPQFPRVRLGRQHGRADRRARAAGRGRRRHADLPGGRAVAAVSGRRRAGPGVWRLGHRVWPGPGLRPHHWRGHRRAIGLAMGISRARAAGRRRAAAGGPGRDGIARPAAAQAGRGRHRHLVAGCVQPGVVYHAGAGAGCHRPAHRGQPGRGAGRFCRVCRHRTTPA